MNICIKNATLISMNLNKDKIEKNIDILIKDDKIVEIGKNLIVEKDTKVIDGKSKVVLPGLINTHAHVPMSIFRETLDGYNLQDWLNKKIWPMEEKLTNEDIYYASYLSFIEMIKTGSTTINDMYFMADEIIRAMKDTGIRLQTTRSLMNISGEKEGQIRFNELVELLNKYENTDSKLTFNIGIHGLYTSNKTYLKKCIQLAKERNLPVHIHFCENSKEVENIKESYNEQPTNILKNEFEGLHTILAHAVKLSDEDIEKIKDMNIAVSHCPVSNLRLGCGIAKIEKMLEEKINISLGTDGQGSGSNLDLFETMKFVGLLQKGINENPKILPAYEVLKMATINGAKALCLEQEIGSIEIGKKADLIIINLDNVKIKPENDLISEIVYNVKGTDVETTIIDGKILMENKVLNNNINENKTYDMCDKIINRIHI